MRRPRPRLPAALLLGLTACNLDSNGLRGSDSGMFADTGDSSGQAGSSTGAPGSTSMAQTTGSATTGPAGSTGIGTTGAGDGTSGGNPGAAHLVFMEAPSFDYGAVSVGSGGQMHAFTLSNQGGTKATAIAASGIGPGFAYDGGTYPGIGGDCGASLAPTQSCTVAVRFDPPSLGQTDAQLQLGYYDGTAAAVVKVALTGGGAGQTDNLLVNGDGELGGNPPSGWTVQLGSASASVSNSHTGSWAIEVTGTIAAEIHQDVDVSSLGSAIDAGGFRFGIDGYTSDSGGVESRRIRVEFRGGSNSLGDFQTDLPTTSDWMESQKDGVAPSGTRTIRVHLTCSGAGSCVGYFDDLVLRGMYP